MSNFTDNEAHSKVLARLGVEFRSESLFTTSITHTSYTNETPGETKDNQRLEFLGDAVVGLVVAEALMERAPAAGEGQLTACRAALVREESLAELARRVGLGDVLRLGRGEELNNGRDRTSILADAVEAVIGAIYLDGGYEASKNAVLKWYGGELDKVVTGNRPDDEKSALQEILQSQNRETPIYEVVLEEGPDHAKVYEVAIRIDGEIVASGRGRSKKAAEKDAARRALFALGEVK